MTSSNLTEAEEGRDRATDATFEAHLLEVGTGFSGKVKAHRVAQIIELGGKSITFEARVFFDYVCLCFANQSKFVRASADASHLRSAFTSSLPTCHLSCSCQKKSWRDPNS